MKLAEIKSKYSMLDILARYNIKVTKGFCKCPLHKGDNTPSMKVYKDGFYCFGCGAGGDFIKFVQLHDHLTFEEACKWISGEELDRKTKRQLSVASLRREREARKKKNLEEELKTVNRSFSGLWQKYLDLQPKSSEDPFSNEWAEAYNKWQLLCYKQTEIIKKLEG